MEKIPTNPIPFSENPLSGDITGRVLFDFILPTKEDCHIIRLNTAVTEPPKHPATVQFYLCLPDGDATYMSPWYEVDGPEKAWRLPPSYFDGVTARFTMCVPDGEKLTVTDFTLETEHFSGTRPMRDAPVEFDGHLGLFGYTPENTEIGFRTAGLCGFEGCIANIKRTADGQYVCLHDQLIGRTGRMDNGDGVEENYCVYDLTYEELLKYDFGYYKHPLFKGQRIVQVEDYFKICKQYGMKPIFSVDPCLPAEQWQEVREIAERIGVFDRLKVKTDNAKDLTSIFEVFGNDCGGYILWKMAWDEQHLTDLIGVGFDPEKVEGVLEIRETDGSENVTPEIAAKIHAAGMKYSCLSCWGLYNGPYYRRHIANGADEFNDDCHTSMGLNW